MDLQKLENNFKQNVFNNEDDIKIHFYAEIMKPLLDELNSDNKDVYYSENHLKAGGIADATFRNISFEYKKEGYFSKESGKHEALYGKNDRDHGLYDYIISHADINHSDNSNDIVRKLLSGIGVGFDGKKFIFARFISSSLKKEINTKKVKATIKEPLNLEFVSEEKDFQTGLKRLALLIKQRDKISLSKRTLCEVINPKSSYVRKSILQIYNNLEKNINPLLDTFNNRVKLLYTEWDRVFGKMYGEDKEATDFTEVSSKIREMYGIDELQEVDSKKYLFSMQTFFNIFLKLLVYSFLSQLVDPMFTIKHEFTKHEINKLFSGDWSGKETKGNGCRLVDNFFETHFLEWFTFTVNYEDREDSFDVSIVNESLNIIDDFDLSTFVLRPENVQDILQEVYMGLIPSEMRHLMGEYFSPDWIVEHVLEMVGYNGDIDKTLIDPTAGSGSFLTHAIKKIILNEGGVLSKETIFKITQNIVGFDINPISVVAAKANYILIMFSAYFDNCNEEFGDPISIPVFIADSVLAPIIYTEENDKTFIFETAVGKIEIPKFKSISKGNKFLKLLSNYVDDLVGDKYGLFEALAIREGLVDKYEIPIIKELYEKIVDLHRGSKDSFWPIIFRNSFAPVIIRNKFDFVVGNPPWIAWKAMSKSYREGTLNVWKSYGIFEKNAYDKKTTHDDFGMAVTYVAIDQYLKDGGKMVFLLPASFLKSTKGGEGFRKFNITRKGQKIPFSVEEVHDFSGVSLFSIPTVAIKFNKGSEMKYPLNKYRFYTQPGRKNKIDSHADWEYVSKIIEYKDCLAQPVDKANRQSAWLTLKDMSFANHVLDTSVQRFYKGRKGIEPAGAKGVYVLLPPQKAKKGFLNITNDISRQRRKDILNKGVHKGCIEEKYVYPMLGGRNIARWQVKSNEFMLVPHTAEYKYGIPEIVLAKNAPQTFQWLSFYRDELLDSRKKNGKFFNSKTQPFYRLDNVGTYTYSPYKVLWKEQTGSMSAVVVSTYLKSIPNADIELFSEDKPIVVDSKVLMLDVYNELEAYYVCGIINSPSVIEVVDGYAVTTNRGTDVLKYIAIPKFDSQNAIHIRIANISKEIHLKVKNSNGKENISGLESNLDTVVYALFSKDNI